ncbi:hypothetical protein PUNSTDRAFT_60653 [Punctularia strigosozonata HHB-11173 SS5]|uniref:uncharacterized protein n=1 Tax=Punctularia strigosozonata (strain HHB-11173) TaxID=741275 RepID=UPI0004418117|nr:uncharacterized protein PUNSTDRAFT_60653 [Punctularia strigosozonata HHB-11173 SS5]EIN12584.1 hypothetical protein PUNSTDRAFT_60653 [Punctularia strigosozonata HHB-11173 SS5]
MATDRNYRNLLAHLHDPSTKLALPAIQAAVAHYIASLEPAPTPLAAIVVSSPYFRACEQTQLDALSTAFRHAVHLKYKAAENDHGGVFSPGTNARMNTWAKATLAGLQGGHPLLRLACAGGLLQGLDDTRVQLGGDGSGARGRSEAEVVLAFAAAIDQSPSNDAWAGSSDAPNTDVSRKALTLACRSLPLVSSRKMTALPLDVVADLTSSEIISAFQSGHFMASLPRASSRTPATATRVCHLILTASLSTEEARRLLSSSEFAAVAPLSKLCARSISLLADTRPQTSWGVMAHVIDKFRSATEQVDAYWRNIVLQTNPQHQNAVPDAREAATSAWTVLKTLLFSVVMISDAVLVSATYTPPSSSSSSSSNFQRPTPPSLALATSTLRTLGNLSFVISQFGGITSEQGGFAELKKVVYLALDILATDPAESQAFARAMAEPVQESSSVGVSSDCTPRERAAFVLAMLEQLVPALSDESLQDVVFPVAFPYLDDSAHREIYEAAHSVTLAIFAARGRPPAEVTSQASSEPSSERFADRLVPFYSECLLSNCSEGQLSIAQLRLAYAALVKGAGASPTKGDILAQYCVDQLLEKIHSLPASSPSGSQGQQQTSHRLHLTLVATVSSLPYSLLGGVLESIGSIIAPLPNVDGTKAELIEALYNQLLEVGDREKALAMAWWHSNRRRLYDDRASEHQDTRVETSTAENIHARL